MNTTRSSSNDKMQTLTTVGYGDIAPQTVFGQILATVVMLSGYGIIACPLVLSSGSSGEALRPRRGNTLSVDLRCPKCPDRPHLMASRFCHLCGSSLVKMKSFMRRKKSNRVRTVASREQQPLHESMMMDNMVTTAL